MRLIDADNLNFEGQHYNKSQMKAILDFVDSQPTAYDVDAVVEQLEAEGSKIEIQYENNYEKGLSDGIGKAIEIVKGSGIDER